MNNVFVHKRGDLSVREVDGETVILDRTNELIHTLNTSAAYIWSRLDGETGIVEIAQGLAQAFSIDMQQAQADVQTAIDNFGSLQLLEVNPGSLPGVPDKCTRRQA